MITFLTAIIVLILGYFIYGRIIERVFKFDNERKTPALSMPDGVDYIPMKGWRIFLIQFLNIAGLGPIFGAVAGAMWGPVAFLWIVLGSIFAGGVHDYFSGMLSIRNEGKGIAEITGKYLGPYLKVFMRGFTVFLMIMVGTVFVVGPANILDELTSGWLGANGWVWIVFVYYVLATILPVDKIIGRIYPVFGVALLFMAMGLLIPLLSGAYPIPELTMSNLLMNQHDRAGSFPVFPMLFVTIACGAISGFHATQSPLMARCMTSERQGRSIFYGAMISEGVVALIWAAIGMTFFGGIKELNIAMNENQGNAAVIVNTISHVVLGPVGGVLAILGVVAAPLTSGDTAFRSARLIVSDFLKLSQAGIKNRIIISIPLFAVGYMLSLLDFGIIWRYFAWSNQTLATIVLWTITVYLASERKPYWFVLLPAVFMTEVVTSYILLAPEGLSLPMDISFIISFIITLLVLAAAMMKIAKLNRFSAQLEGQ
ncbi:MAG: carbon starvation protein A [Cyclobacteriaceae bacterium]|nr:carbon starvation protein A [Cyclobacteriaceae bacterium]MDH4298216.1 carbon starvation protein A [Cyclobacteriaceae bacterium]